MKPLAYSKDAVKALRKMQPKGRLAVLTRVEAFANGERVDVKKMQGSEFVRIRVGDDRVIIDEQTATVLVVKVGPRGDVYKDQELSMGEVSKLTIGGATYVVLPEEEYEDLLELSEARAIKARIDAGEETWPHGVVKALAEGESPVRVFRKHRGLKVADLARQTGLSGPFISEIESGKKQGSVEALKTISNALGVDLDDLV
jgi:mRNA-degrading endonuclease RelE of RelBE toxin-antitoxin system/antitoxin component HigA of HigAB toxin-antitoxin module